METGRFISVDAANGIQMSKSQKKMKYESIKKKNVHREQFDSWTVQFGENMQKE